MKKILTFFAAIIFSGTAFAQIPNSTFTKWNTATSKRDTIAFKNYALPGMVMSWGTFTIPLTYYSYATPDSAIIVLSASGTTPVVNSYLYVDNLAFSGTGPSNVGVANVA